MKKLLTVLLTVLMVCGLAACSSSKTETESGPVEETPKEDTETPTASMKYADFVAADVDAEVEVLMYVQATQAWWEDDGQGKVTIYGADIDGGYFVYEALVDEETAAKLATGTLIKVKGYKGEWAGEVEIMEATVEVFADQEQLICEPVDVTEYIGTENLETYMNQKVTMKDLTVTNVTFKDSEYDPDVYIECRDANENVVNLCVENYLTDPTTDVYQTAAALQTGARIDVEGFLYWYEGANPHVTSITSHD